MDVQRKFGILRAIGWVLQALGVIFFLVVVIAVLVLLFSGDNVVRLVGVAMLPIGIIGSIQVFVVGALVTLMTDLEHNTRGTNAAIVQLSSEVAAMSAELKSVTGNLIGDVRQLSADMRGYTNEVRLIASPPPMPPEPEPEVQEETPSEQG